MIGFSWPCLRIPDELLLGLVDIDPAEEDSLIAVLAVAFFDSSMACLTGATIPVHPEEFPLLLVLPLLDELPREELYLEGRLPP